MYWLEGRPAEGGRQTVMRAPLAGSDALQELTPTRSVRSRVHEYGGGDYRVERGVLVAADPEGGVFLAGAASGVLASARRSARYGDFAFSPDGRWIVAVEEEAAGEGAVENRLVALARSGRERIVIAAGHDFVASPCFAADGERLAFLSWEHPDMPWDATTLQLLRFGAAGPASDPRRVAGGREEAIVQPSFSPAGALRFVSDRSGWWNLWEERGDALRPLCPREAEFGLPLWVLGLSTYGHTGEDVIWCTERSAGRDRLACLEVGSGRLTALPLPYEAIEGLSVSGGHVAFVGAAARRAPALCVLDLATRSVRELRRAFALELDDADLAAPEAVEFESDEGRRAHAFLYRPANRAWRAASGERPPLLVWSHGGPTSHTTPALRPQLQYFTSRGFAVIDVDYAGSSGYGRAYRNLLRGQWGVRDVADCAAAARFAAAQGAADPARWLARGGSAGGFTTLCLLSFRDDFAGGASYYGVADLGALARDTHKFESHYLERLVGPWPECEDLYRARSPLAHADRIARPVIFFQGLEDRVVLPAQTEAMVAALAARGVPHAYLRFEGEGHGFRRAESLAAALEAERWFYAKILGLAAGAAPPGVVLRGGGAARR